MILLTSRVILLVGVIREWTNKNFRKEEPRPDSFLERFRGPELQTVTTQQGDGKGNNDGEGRGTKYGSTACETRRVSKHAIGGFRGFHMPPPWVDYSPHQALPWQEKGWG